MEHDFYLEHPCAHMTQMNLRVSSVTAAAFRNFCKEQKLTQNEALSVLLTHASDSTLAQNAALTEIARCKRALEELNEKYADITAKQHSKEESDWTKVRDWAKVMQDMLSYILERKVPGRWPTIRPGYFKRDHNQLEFSQYQYPKESRCFLVQLDNLIYSKGRYPALFILAHRVNENGELEYLKFRYYPRSRFVGVALNASVFACQGAEWLIGCIPAPDGAMNVFASLPIAGLKPTDILLDALNNTMPKSNLDQRILDAERRRSKS